MRTEEELEQLLTKIQNRISFYRYMQPKDYLHQRNMKSYREYAEENTKFLQQYANILLWCLGENVTLEIK